MSYRNRLPSLKIPEELRLILQQFTVSYLMDQPGDIIDYAVEYFSRLKKHRVQGDGALKMPSMLSSDIKRSLSSSTGMKRRPPIFSSRVKPDEELPIIVCNFKTDEDRQKISSTIENLLVFRNIDAEQLREVVDHMYEKPVIAGDLIIEQDEPGDYFYIIKEGTFYIYAIEVDGVCTRTDVLDNSGYFGETALMYRIHRSFTVQAQTNGILWVIDRNTFKKILLKSEIAKRELYESFIQKVPMFSSLTRNELIDLTDALVPKKYEAGESVYRACDVADGMYFIKKGHIAIETVNNAKEKSTHELSETGDYFGQLAMVTYKPRAESAYAVDDTTLVFLDVEAFERILGPCIQIMKRNIQEYEQLLLQIFNSKTNITNIR